MTRLPLATIERIAERLYGEGASVQERSARTVKVQIGVGVMGARP